MICQPGGGGCHNLCHTRSSGGPYGLVFMSLPMFHDSCHEEAVLQSRFTHYSFTHLFFNLNSRYAQYGLFSVASHGHILKKEIPNL